MTHWYAIRAISRQEGFAASALNEAGYLAYVPQHVTEARFAKRKATRTKPLIPGYVFAELPDDDAIQAAFAIRGVIREGRLIQLRPLEVGAMILADACHLFDETWKPPRQKGKRYSHRWKAGDQIGIYKGPFTGFSGLVLKTKNRGRMDVLVTLFGRALEIEIEERDLTTPEGLADKLAA